MNDSYHLIDLISRLADLMDQMHDQRDRQILFAQIKILTLQFRLQALKSSAPAPQPIAEPAVSKKTKGPVKSLVNNKHQDILDVFEKDKKLRVQEIMKTARVSKRTVLRHLKELTDEGIIQRKVENGVVFFIRSAITSSS